MIGIPDYVSGATEHWGLITYREENLLFDDVKSSAGNKEQVAMVVAHEIAHMVLYYHLYCLICEPTPDKLHGRHKRQLFADKNTLY